MKRVPVIGDVVDEVIAVLLRIEVIIIALAVIRVTGRGIPLRIVRHPVRIVDLKVLLVLVTAAAGNASTGLPVALVDGVSVRREIPA